MKKYLIYSILLFNFATTFSQSWQWGKRGGSDDQISMTSGGRQEEAYSIVTDSQKNIYMLSTVGNANLNFDGVPDINYDNSPTTTDVALVSFSCEGTFRWSKIIGGAGIENFHNLKIDNQDNIYLAGRFGLYADATFSQHIDDDVTISTSTVDYRKLVILKYNSNGEFQWYQRPEPNIINLSSYSSGLQIDDEGNLCWLVALAKPGNYADGALTVTNIAKPWHVLKYNSSGNFISATILDLQTPLNFGKVQFYRNPFNGRFFVTAEAGSNAGSIWATVGSETITHSLFMACFEPAGQAVWKRENTSNIIGKVVLYNLLFDIDNSIYLGGRISGFNSDIFMGLTISEPTMPGFVMKIDSMATGVIWSTYHNKQANKLGAITMNDTEIGFTNFCSYTDFTWGSQALNVGPTNHGTAVLFARLNKNTGECLSLTKIPDNIGFDDYGCALAVDASGDYIVGGNFSAILTFDGGVNISSGGGESDFFIAKYATQACSTLAVVENEFENLTHYPNPTTGILNLVSDGSTQYELFDLKGTLVAKGITSPTESKIDLCGFAIGTYVLRLVNEKGEKRSWKVLKY